MIIMTTKPQELVKNLFITIEGIDGVGKNTQAKLLQQALSSHDNGCTLYSFPRYDTPTGIEVRRYLTGNHDNKSLLARAKLYSDDRLAAREDIFNDLFANRNVICDRFVDSNACYQSSIAQLENGPLYAYKVREYIYELEYGNYLLPVPDVTFILSVDVETSQRMMSERYNNDETLKDKHEKDIELLKLVHESYRQLSFTKCNRAGLQLFIEIICNDEHGKLRSQEDIHNEILTCIIEDKTA